MNNSVLKSTAQGFIDTNGVLNIQNPVLVAMQDPDLNNQTFVVALEQVTIIIILYWISSKNT